MTGMKQEVNYKLITLAVGIAVAVAVAFTFWIETPLSGLSGPQLKSFRPGISFARTIARTTSRLMENTVSMITDRHIEKD
jgi:hypothetical protein